MDSPDPLSEADRAFLREVEAETKARNAGAAARLAADPSVHRILFFGSASTGRGFRFDSDIDLAVEGGDILAHRAVAEGSTFAVDVIDILALPEPMRELLEPEGELLYEKCE